MKYIKQAFLVLGVLQVASLFLAYRIKTYKMGSGSYLQQWDLPRVVTQNGLENPFCYGPLLLISLTALIVIINQNKATAIIGLIIGIFTGLYMFFLAFVLTFSLQFTGPHYKLTLGIGFFVSCLIVIALNVVLIIHLTQVVRNKHKKQIKVQTDLLDDELS